MQAAALKHLTKGKAAGVDGIRAKFILDASKMLLDLLVQTFNQVLNKYPPPPPGRHIVRWFVSSYLKAGDPDDPGNYRRASVLSSWPSCMQWF